MSRFSGSCSELNTIQAMPLTHFRFTSFVIACYKHVKIILKSFMSQRISLAFNGNQSLCHEQKHRMGFNAKGL
jgi:hypothetical protein